MTTPAFHTLYPADETTMLVDAYEAITQCELWEWLKNYTPDRTRGFMFSNDPNLERINDALKYGGHSGSSYGWTMRVMESIAKEGWEAHRNSVREARAAKRLAVWARDVRGVAGTACPCRREKGYTDGWCGVAGGGVPPCTH